MFDISESGKEIGEKLFILLSTKQQQELKQFIMDIECGKIRLADILSYPFGSHVICCMNKNAGKAKFEIEKDDLFFSLEQRLVMIQNKVIALTAKEFDLLELLAVNPGKVYSRDNLLKAVWGQDYSGDGRTVDVHMRRLREKIEDNPSEPKYVHTKWGVGYYFNV